MKLNEYSTEDDVGKKFAVWSYRLIFMWKVVLSIKWYYIIVLVQSFLDYVKSLRNRKD